MTFLGLEARTDLPKVPYPPALDFFVFLSFAFIFATIIQVSKLYLTDLVGEIQTPLMISLQAVPWLRRSVAGLSPRRPGFDPGSVHVGFVVDNVALGQVFLRVLRFSPVSIYIIITGLH